MGETPYSKIVLGEMHKILLETLRQREQQIIQYLAILVPAFTGFGWLAWNLDAAHKQVFVYGTLAVMGLLYLGAFYSLSLGYNFRYIVLELSKLEVALKIESAMLIAWPRTRKQFSRYKICNTTIPWCAPPGIIKIFWYAFVLGILGVMITGYSLAPERILLIFGEFLFLTGFLLPIWYGFKFRKLWKKEFTDGESIKIDHVSMS
jgi:hypothetical protein